MTRKTPRAGRISSRASGGSAPPHPPRKERSAGGDARFAKRGLPDAGSAEFAYLVAGYAWRDGLTANAIVRRLDLPSTAHNLMNVKRALKRAQGRFLKLIPPEAPRLEVELSALVNGERARNPIRFTVVEDEWAPSNGPVIARAAELTMEMILEAARRPPARVAAADEIEPQPRLPDVVICNAGGHTISAMVKSLVRNPPAADESDQPGRRLRDRLIFVAGNAAYLPDQFNRSANFLSVTMAELFGAQHLALPQVEDEHFPKHHKDLLDRTSVFVCGAGSRDFGLISKYFNDRSWEIPAAAVGDIAFNLIDENGDEVELTGSAKDLMRRVNPTLNLNRLLHIAAHNRVLLILDSEEPAQKVQVSLAVLKRAYVTDVILGSRLAREILQAK